MPRVFLSYARADGEERASEIRDRLVHTAPDIVIVQDRSLLEGGFGWWMQVTGAIDSVEFLLLVMTPAAIGSGNAQKEWRYARQQGVWVYPVKGAPVTELRFERMPRWMGAPFMAPDPPPHLVQRPAEFDVLKSLLLTAEGGGPVAITTALAGAAGSGKRRSRRRRADGRAGRFCGTGGRGVSARAEALDVRAAGRSSSPGSPGTVRALRD